LTDPGRLVVPEGSTAPPAPSLPVRLVALDIDGTLVDDDLILRDRTREAVRSIARRGIPVSLVTGRMASSAWTFAETLRLRDPIVAYQGAIIRSMPPWGAGPRRDGGPPVGRLLRHTPLAADVAREAIVWCWANRLDPHVNHLERFVIRADDPLADDYSTFLGARAELVPDILAAVTHPVTKIIATAPAGIPAAALGPARARFAGRAEVTLSHPRFLEFVAPGITKGLGLRWLARRARVPLGAALAIGDQWNDLEMIVAAGHGAAMAGAPAGVRLAARYVTPPLREEGAAQLLEDLVLAGPREAARRMARWLDAAEAAHAVAAEELDRSRLDVPGGDADHPSHGVGP
jgi:Cof subfamily protein (haloacid dehalogenase superfamily)